MTLPGFIDSTIPVVISFGAGLPGINAVVTMMSTCIAEPERSGSNKARRRRERREAARRQP